MVPQNDDQPPMRNDEEEATGQTTEVPVPVPEVPSIPTPPTLEAEPDEVQTTEVVHEIVVEATISPPRATISPPGDTINVDEECVLAT